MTGPPEFKTGDIGRTIGEEDFAEFYREHAGRLEHYLVARTGSLEQAKDLGQTIWLKLLKKLRSGQLERATARGYLYTVARNAIVDRGKEKKAEPLSRPDLLPAREAGMDNGLIRNLFLEAISTLPEELAALLEMRLLEQRPVAEILSKLGGSRATLHRNLEKGLGEVARHFRTAGYNLEDLL
ncbi:MAG: sigma-70 family RNA polymerase sigma factor [Spirochaetales bacterium]|nr:sigma-70 family RNA polymerase sigma factor [Spirochaetales bacterium]